MYKIHTLTLPVLLIPDHCNKASQSLGQPWKVYTRNNTSPSETSCLPHLLWFSCNPWPSQTMHCFIRKKKFDCSRFSATWVNRFCIPQSWQAWMRRLNLFCEARLKYAILCEQRGPKPPKRNVRECAMSLLRSFYYSYTFTRFLSHHRSSRHQSCALHPICRTRIAIKMLDGLVVAATKQCIC